MTSSGWGRGTTTDRWPVVASTPRDVEHVVGFQAEVELLHDGLGEQLDQRRRVGQGGDGDPADEVGGDPAHGGQIRPHGRGDRGTLHFYHHLLAGTEGGGVDLGDGRGGQRLALEPAEDLLERAAEVRLDHRPDGFERLGRHPVAEQPELADQLGREEAFAGREDLPELDVGRPEGLERDAQPARTGRPGTARAARAGGPGAARSGTRRRRPGPVRPPTRRTRRPGGRRRRRSSWGTWAAVAARRAAMPARQRRSSGSTSQGGVALNDPTERSAGETEVIPAHATAGRSRGGRGSRRGGLGVGLRRR